MKKLFIAIMAVGSLALTSCGSKSGFSQDSGTNDGQGNSGASWDKVDFQGKADGGANDQKLVTYVDKVNQALLLVLPIPVLIPVIAPMPIPAVSGATLTSYTNADGSQNMAISIPLRKIVRAGSSFPIERLPNGDALPFVTAGELPGFAIQFPQMQNYQIHIFVGINVAAAFVELPDMGIPTGFLSPVKNPTKTKVIGAVGYVVPKNNFEGGVFLAAQLPAELARTMDQLIRW